MLTHIKSNICISTNPARLYKIPRRSQLLIFTANTNPLILNLEDPRITVFLNSCTKLLRENQAYILTKRKTHTGAPSQVKLFFSFPFFKQTPKSGGNREWPTPVAAFQLALCAGKRESAGRER